MIRYQEEEVEINDICHFVLEIDNQQAEIYLEIELMFSDLISLGGPEKFQLSSTLKEIIDQKIEYKSVSTRKFHL